MVWIYNQVWPNFNDYYYILVCTAAYAEWPVGRLQYFISSYIESINVKLRKLTLKKCFTIHTDAEIILYSVYSKHL